MSKKGSRCGGQNYRIHFVSRERHGCRLLPWVLSLSPIQWPCRDTGQRLECMDHWTFERPNLWWHVINSSGFCIVKQYSLGVRGGKGAQHTSDRDPHKVQSSTGDFLEIVQSDPAIPVLLQDASGIGNLFGKSPLVDDGTILLGLEYGRGYPSVLWIQFIYIYVLKDH